jgi:polar amino acid transport system substrate-binding protein
MIAKVPSTAVRTQLAPTGVLRAAINLSNFLLVVEREPSPRGPSPRLAQAVAEALGVPLQLVLFETPSEVAEAAKDNVWDVANIGNEPQRAEHIDFTSAYVEIAATYLVRQGSKLKTATDVDCPGNRVAVKKGSAYGLWLENNMSTAELVALPGSDDEVFAAFAGQHFDALAGLRPGLLKQQLKLSGSKITEGHFTAVQQAVGLRKGRPEALEWLQNFVEDAKQDGLIESWIQSYGLQGKLSVAPLESLCQRSL